MQHPEKRSLLGSMSNENPNNQTRNLTILQTSQKEMFIKLFLP